VSLFVVPSIDSKAWPTLGPGICDFMEENLVHGPGDLRGQPLRLDDEKRGLLYRIYEVFPKGHREAGRRRFKRIAISLRKGSAKTEFAALVAICELHPEAPVRTVEWDARGRPVGDGLVDPYIPMVAYTEEQSEELAYGALRVILENCDLGADFDIGLERVMRLGGDGKVEALSTAPDSRDGARTTFQLFDETHRFTLPRLKKAHRTMLANIPKRKLSDAWSFEITTAPAPGEGSVAEDTFEYARAIAKQNGKAADARLFFFHRASGPVAAWSDIGAICGQWADPKADRAYLRRVWLNQLVQATDRAFDAEAFKALGDTSIEISTGAKVTLGFDGARYHDSVGVVATEIETGHQAVLGAWEKPHPDRDWEVPADEVDQVVAGAFERFNVWRMYADPPYWETNVATWAGTYGDKVVIAWPTNRWRKMADAVRGYVNALQAKELSHDGAEVLVRHIGNAHKRTLKGIRDDKGIPMWVIQKERGDSSHKIDLAMCAVLSWEARRDALRSGEGDSEVYEGRGLVVI
jgi:phage terminase large subunit-like protein